MTVWLGAPDPCWLEMTERPLFVSHNRLRTRTLSGLPYSSTGSRWALDSGGFTVMSRYRRPAGLADDGVQVYPDTPEQYARVVFRYLSRIGNLEWASIQDWMCEPQMLARTGLTVAQHQERTVRSYLDLVAVWARVGRGLPCPFRPALQGHTPADYVLRTTRAFVSFKRSRIGVGRVCCGEANPGLLKAFVLEFGWPNCVGISEDTIECGAGEIGIAEVSAAKIGATQVGILKVGSRQVRKVQVGIDETGLLKVASAEISRLQVAAVQPCALQPATCQVDIAELCIDQSCSIELQAAKVHSRQVKLRPVGELTPAFGKFSPRVWEGMSARQDADRSLDVWREYLQPGAVFDRGRGVVRPVRGADVPWGMVARERTKDELDSVAICGRVLGDALQCVDSADADVDVVTPDLLNGSSEPLGDLSFAIDVDLPPGRCRTHDDQQAGCQLQESRADIVLQLALRLLQLNARLGAGNSLKLCVAQRRIEQLGSHCQADHDAQQADESRCRVPDHLSCHEVEVLSVLAMVWSPPFGSRGWSPLTWRSGLWSLRRASSWQLQLNDGLMCPDCPHLSELLLGGSEADFETVDFPEPAAIVGFTEAVVEVDDDGQQSWLLSGVGSHSIGHRMQACSCPAGAAVGTCAGAELDLAFGEVLLELAPLDRGGFPIFGGRIITQAETQGLITA